MPGAISPCDCWREGEGQRGREREANQSALLSPLHEQWARQTMSMKHNPVAGCTVHQTTSQAVGRSPHLTLSSFIVYLYSATATYTFIWPAP